MQGGPGSQAVAACAEAIANGELVAFPTETVYGLGARADDDTAVARIYAAKGRPPDHPLIVHVATQEAVTRFAADASPAARRLMQQFWPGPLTLILPRRPGSADAAAGGQHSIGLRMPSHPLALALLHAAAERGVPGIAAPSANRFGRISPTSALHVQQEFGPTLRVLDGGACDVGIESAIVDCTCEPPALLRPGQLSRLQIEQALGRPLAAAGTDSPRVPGSPASHYAPTAPLQLLDAPALAKAMKGAMACATTGALTSATTAARARVGIVAPTKAPTNAPTKALAPAPPTARPISTANPGSASGAGTRTTGVYSRVAPPPHGAWVWQAMPVDAAAVAHELFAVLRAFDAAGVAAIWVESPPASADWDGVRDRLQRAAHR
ncbi:MAG: threonylcarbamoyl-AMP synthase [Rubrivivax sp.]|nr:threonylcarbamoyl-AMP synthase [Rubrivivax sp.]